MRPNSSHEHSHQFQDSTPNDDEPPLPISRYLFYSSTGLSSATQLLLPPGYELGMWWPSLRRPWPTGAAAYIRLKFLFRALLQALGFLAAGECGALCLHFGGRLVHYSGFTPRYWRFPFLADEDLQIGDTWTDPAHRGRGLALVALRQILAMKRKPGRKFWYVVGAANAPSIHVAEKAGFRVVAHGTCVKPLGIKFFGSYVMADYPLRAATLAERAS